MIYNCERNLGSTACLTATKKLMKSCLLVDFAKLITRPFCKQGLIAPNTVTLICRLFFGMRTRGCLRDQLLAFVCTLEYVVSSIHMSWWGFEFMTTGSTSAFTRAWSWGSWRGVAQSGGTVARYDPAWSWTPARRLASIPPWTNYKNQK